MKQTKVINKLLSFKKGLQYVDHMHVFPTKTKNCEKTLKMSQQGAALQSYNNELVKCINDLCGKRDELHKQILQEEEEKQKLQNDIRILTERLAKVNESLSKKMASRNEFDKTIAETESAYMKILESSQTLLNVLKRESQTLREKTVPGQRAVQS